MNNYTAADEARISSLRSTQGVYLVYGREVGEAGTPHLQGFVSFPSRKRLNQVILGLGQCHCTIAKYISASIKYCKKDGDFIEFGEPPKDKPQGKRNELEAFKSAVRNEGLSDMKEIRENYSSVYARYRNFVHEYVRDFSKSETVETFPLRDWQAQLNVTLNGPVDGRVIHFLVDVVGNQGKSWFMRYYEQNHPDTTQIILPGKKADMAFVLRENNRVVFFDCPRSKQGEYIQYDFLEEIKNGYVFSTKYESRIKRFQSPHLVVAMNEEPNMDNLSNDRFNIIRL